MKKKVTIAVIVVMIASLSIAGLMARFAVGATDYCDYYNNAWGDRIVEKQFYKTQSDRGNDLYVGVVRNASSQYPATLSLEHVKTQSDAAKIYTDTVAAAQSAGYMSMVFSSSEVKPDLFVERWQGTTSLNYLHVTYYYSEAVNSWLVYEYNLQFHD